MTTLRNFLIVSAAAGLLAACAGPDIGMLQSMPDKGTAFDKALHAGYTKLAKEEADEYDTADADHFGDKAKLAAEGMNVEPDMVGSRKLDKKYVPELKKAYGELVKARASDARTKMPGQLAEAQTMYDCWIQEAEENIQPADISRCLIGFNAAMAEIRSGMMTKPMAKAMPAKPMAPKKESYMVYFSFNSATLTPVADRIVQKAAAAIMGGSKAVFVIGNTDTAGSSDYNRNLADRRADAVIAQLRKDGVKSPVSKIVAGESNPAEKTGDGVREPLNRRVEIAITR